MISKYSLRERKSKKKNELMKYMLDCEGDDCNISMMIWEIIECR